MELDPQVEASITEVLEKAPPSEAEFIALKMLLNAYPDDEDFANRFVKIKDKQGHIVPFTFNRCQKYLEQTVRNIKAAGRRVMLVILKPRQVGCSLWTQFHLLMNILRNEHHSALVIADHKGNAKYLFSIGERMFLSLPYRPELRRGSVEELVFDDPLGSDYSVETAMNPRAGRSRTIHHVHASEVAFWNNPVVVMTALQQAVADHKENWIVIESTANGLGDYFYDKWKEAETGESDFVPVFFPWYMHDEYELPLSSPEAKVIKLHGMDEEEESLFDKGVRTESLAWRRWAIKNKCFNSVDTFHQEYPATAEEAFLVSGRPVFPPDIVKKLYLSVVDPVWQGDLEIRGPLTRSRDGSIRHENVEGSLGSKN